MKISAVAIFFIVMFHAAAFPAGPKLSVKVHRDCVSACHKTHGAKGEGILLKNERLDTICSSCHDSKDRGAFAGEARQISSPMNPVSSHINFREERSKPSYRKRFSLRGKKYFLEDNCSGCHDPHLSRGEKLKEFSFDTRGEIRPEKRRFVGELCLGCHAGPDSANTLRMSDIGPAFSPSARSNHSLGSTPDTRRDLPSLRLKLYNKELDCISCHNSPEGNGPHYSMYPSLLAAPFKREMDGISYRTESDTLYFICHSRDSIEANESFPLHNEHLTGIFNIFPGGRRASLREREEFFTPLPSRRIGLVKERFAPGFGTPTPCATCHDPHGSFENPFLINFDSTVVSPSSTGRIEYRKTGPGTGHCTLSCHGHDHIDSDY